LTCKILFFHFLQNISINYIFVFKNYLNFWHMITFDKKRD